MKRGRPINTKAVLEVRRYRKMGLGTNEIARLMKKNVRQIKRWDHYIDIKKVKVAA